MTFFIYFYNYWDLTVIEDLDWELDSLELCKKAYSQISLLVQSKICWYVYWRSTPKMAYSWIFLLVQSKTCWYWRSTKDLLQTCISFIGCLLKYASVWSGTGHFNGQPVQKTCLRVILGNEYKGLWDCTWNVQAWYLIEVRREKLCLSYENKCLLNTNQIFMIITLQNRTNSQLFKPGWRG